MKTRSTAQNRISENPSGCIYHSDCLSCPFDDCRFNEELEKNIDKTIKKCAHCGKEYPNTKEFFHVHTVRMTNGKNWQGLRPECKSCRSIVRRKYRREKGK